MDHHFGQIHQQVHELSKGKIASTSASAPNTDQDQLGEERVETQPANSRGATPLDLASLLKVLKVDVPRFNGQKVHNYLYTIEKFFSLHSFPPGLRLQVVAFHLDGEAASWY